LQRLLHLATPELPVTAPRVFTLTPDAATAIIAARHDAGVPEDWGVRFCSALEQPTGITFEFVAGPQPNDILGGSQELRTYVEMAVYRDVGEATVECLDVGGAAELVVRSRRASRAGNLPAHLTRA
jgi:hypothetical protein